MLANWILVFVWCKIAILVLKCGLLWTFLWILILSYWYRDDRRLWHKNVSRTVVYHDFLLTISWFLTVNLCIFLNTIYFCMCCNLHPVEHCRRGNWLLKKLYANYVKKQPLWLSVWSICLSVFLSFCYTYIHTLCVIVCVFLTLCLSLFHILSSVYLSDCVCLLELYQYCFLQIKLIPRVVDD